MALGKYVSVGLFLLASLSSLAFVRANAAAALAYDGTKSFFAEERELFASARMALIGGDIEAFSTYQSQLGNYPIADYLEFERIRVLLKTSSLKQGQALIANFGAEYPDKTLSARLGHVLLASLAKQESWESYFKLVQEKRYSANECDELLAKVKVRGVDNGFDQQARTIWEKARKHPPNCQIAFDIIEKKSSPHIASIWTRILALMDRGRVNEVEEMFRHLSSKDKKPLKLWAKYYAKPGKLLSQKGALSKDSEVNRRVVVNLIKRWSKRDSVAAYEYWSRMRGHYTISRKQRYEVDELIARMAGYDRVPEAYQWLQVLPEEFIDNKVRFWRIRAALHKLDWQAVISSVKDLPSDQQAKSQWQYWLARGEEQVGDKALANSIFQALSTELSYHGFLAADRVNKPYAISDTVEVNERIKNDLAKTPKLIRAREYEYAGIAWEGRREWMSEISGFDDEQQYAAAALALDWGWADRSLYTVAKTGNKKAIDLRFPTLYRSDVLAAAVNENIDSAWIYGVMRRESGFVADIKSGAGAVGLMQLMPATAKDVARRKGRKRSGDLTNASNNITLGSSYLRYVSTIFAENRVLATAAYNAGPSRVKRWLPTDNSIPVDVWVDTIPYTETRRYVRAVTTYTAIFEKQLNGQVTPIGERIGKEIKPSMVISRR